MPQIGDIKQGLEVGYKNNLKVIWQACINCGKERWIPLVKRKGKRFTGLCHKCNNKSIRNLGVLGGWGKSGVIGKFISGRGYWYIKLQPDDFFYPMVGKYGWVFEHRLVMAKHLGRNLHRWEIIHHKHTKYPAGSIEDKQDNRIENLQLVSDDRHMQITLLERRIKYLENLLIENEVKFH